MTAPKVTQCPECSAAFRITQKQLDTASGAVRCGSCLFIFNAYAYSDRSIHKNTPQTPDIRSRKQHKAKHAGVIVKKKRVSTPNYSNYLNKSNPTNLPDPDIQTLFAIENSAELIQQELEQVFIAKTVFNKTTWFKRGIWGSLITLLITLLFIQYLLLNKHTLAVDPEYRDLYTTLCQHLNCSLPPFINIDHIKNRKLVIQQHPQKKAVLLVDSVIINESPYPQPFPLIALTFSDINGKTVTRTVLKPDEYLGGKLTGTRDIPSNQPIRLGFEIIDPDQEAVSYTLTFLPDKLP